MDMRMSRVGRWGAVAGLVLGLATLLGAVSGVGSVFLLRVAGRRAAAS